MKKDMKDKVLETLLEKKIELLNSLLLCSQLSLTLMDEINILAIQEKRELLLEKLMKNDRCINERELQLNLSAHVLEPKRIDQIKSIIETIQYNNEDAFRKISAEKEQLDQERKRFGKTSQLSGYISTQKSFQTFKPIIPKINKKVFESKKSRSLFEKSGINRYIRGKNENKSIAR